MCPGPAGLLPPPHHPQHPPMSQHTPGGGESDSFIHRPQGWGGEDRDMGGAQEWTRGQRPAWGRHRLWSLPWGPHWLLYFQRPPTLPLAVAPAFLLLQMGSKLVLSVRGSGTLVEPPPRPWQVPGRPLADIRPSRPCQPRLFSGRGARPGPPSPRRTFLALSKQPLTCTWPGGAWAAVC